eukprot:1342993-Pyramimonas_sp.AAC.1
MFIQAEEYHRHWAACGARAADAISDIAAIMLGKFEDAAERYYTEGGEAGGRHHTDGAVIRGSRKGLEGV